MTRPYATRQCALRQYATRHDATRQHATRQRGVGTLAVSSLLLFVVSIIAFYLNRTTLFEQKTSANQMQATQAMEAAEAGIEWATGMLNLPYDISTTCAALSTTNASFRKRYVVTQWNAATNPTTNVVAATNTFPGCRLLATGLTCSCPNVPVSGTAVASLGSTAAPSFTVAFADVAGDAEAVRITAWGCTAQAAACTQGTAGGADANASVSVIVKLRPILRAAPASPLTCGTSCTVGGSYNIVNGDIPTNGILINAGSNIATAPGTSMTTLPGAPAANALVGNDASLSALSSADPTCSSSQMFNAYFGSTMEQYRDQESTKVLSCTSTSDCRTKLQTAYDEGARSFYFESDVQLSGNGTLGSRTDPVTLVTPHALTVNGTWDIWGVIFSNSADWNNLGTGSANIHGAQVTCAAYNNNGNGTITYDAETLKNLRRQTGLFVRVPGSWRDF